MAKVLVVDDDPDVVDACRLVLESKGHTVVCAYSRTEGMKSLQQNKPDLLLLDVMMEQPDDGLAMAQELRRTGYKSPILMLTNISKITGIEYGKDKDLVPVDAFIEKPVSAAKLAAKVAELLGKEK